jgi:hypothetical protein
MADSGQTIRELLSGFNNMQASLGLLPTSGQSQGFQGGMTPPPQMKHPGEISVEMVQRASQQASYTMQAAMMPRQMPAPGVLGLTAGNAPVAPPPQQGGVGGQFSREFGARMQSIQSQYMSPYQAQFYAGASGQEGFQNLPSPTFMTPPSMGIFRPAAPPPPPIQIARDRPFITTPFTPRMPAPMFQTAQEMRHQQGVGYDEDMWSGVMGAVPTAGRLGMGALGMLGGASFGAGAAAAAFGPRAAGLGRVGGMIGGAALGFGALGGMAERGMEGLMQPIVQTRAFGRQLETLTQPNVVGGADVNSVTGRGLTARAGIGLANQMQGMVGRGETSGFNMRDLMKITGSAADTGMLDMAQSGEQIASTVRNIARGLSSFMRIAQEPDLRRAMQQMSSMRTMGLTIPETTVAMQNAQTYARMSGTSVEGIMRAGMPGAMTFQQQGMTAGLGMQVGMGALGMARQAVAAGAYTPGQLAMAGGVSGIQQTLTEGSAAGLGVNFPIAAMVMKNAQGKLAIDPSRVSQLMSGQLNMSQQAAMASENIGQLGDPAKGGGVHVIQELSSRMNELRDEMGRALGPQGSLLYTMQQAQNLRKEVPGLTFGSALTMMGMNAQQARTTEIWGEDPGTWRNLRRQSQMSIERMRSEESDRLEAVQGGASVMSRLGRTGVGQFLGGAIRRTGDIGHDIAGGVASWWSDRTSSSDAAERGAGFYRQSNLLGTESKRSRKALDEYFSSGSYMKAMEGEQSEFARGADPISGEALRGSLFNAAIGVAGMAVGGVAGLALPAFVNSGASQTSKYYQSLRAQGGVTGAMAGLSASATNILGYLAGEDHQQETVAAGDAVGELGRAFSSAGGMTADTVKEVRKNQRELSRQYESKFGKTSGTGFDDDTETGVVNDLLGDLKSKAGVFQGTMDINDVKQRIIDSMVRRGKSKAFATKYVNSQSDAVELVLRRAEREAGPDAAATIAKIRESQGLGGFGAAMDFKERQKVIEDKIDQLREDTGANDWFNVSKETFKEFATLATETPEDEMLYMQSLALRGDGDIAGADKILNQIKGDKTTLSERLGSKFQNLTKDQKDMMRRSAKASLSSGKGAAEYLKKVKSGILTGRGMGEASAVEASMVDAGITGAKGISVGTTAAVEEVMSKIAQDSKQREKLSPDEAKALQEWEKAKSPEDKQAAVIKFQSSMRKRAGAMGTTGELGGRGAGGAAEGREQDAQKRRDELEKSISDTGWFGDSDKEKFAKAVNVFGDGAIALQKSTENLSGLSNALALHLRMPAT